MLAKVKTVNVEIRGSSGKVESGNGNQSDMEIDSVCFEAMQLQKEKVIETKSADLTDESLHLSNLDLNGVPMVLFEDIQTFEVDTDGNMLPIEPYSSNDNSKLPEVETGIYTSESSGRASSGTLYVPSDTSIKSYNETPAIDTIHRNRTVSGSRYDKKSVFHLDTSTRNIIKETQPTSSSLLPSQSLKPVKLTDFNQVVIEPACSALLPSQPQKAMNLTEINQVVIKPTRKNDAGARIKDKVHCCYFCGKFIQQMAIHFELIHSNELEVARLLAMPKKTKARRDGFGILIKIGGFHNNCEVIEKKKGEMILVRKPSQRAEAKNYECYGPCPRCLGFFLKELLWHHMKYSCKASGDSNRSKSAFSESNALMASTVGKSNPEFYENILSRFTNDKISLVCKQDSLIFRFGLLQFEKYYNTQNDLIRQTMRQLARLLVELRKTDSEKNWLKPQHFDDIIESIKSLCKFETSNISRPGFSIPSLALKLGHALRKCVAIEKGFSIRKVDVAGVQMLTSFLSLMDLEWSVRISSNALNTLHVKKINAVELLPLTDDLVKLNSFLNNKILFHKQALHLAPQRYEEWRKLASYTLCKIVLFNKRRSGEAAKMTILNYTTRPNWSQAGTDEYKQAMSDLERQLANSLSLVQISGKRGRIVSVLLSNDVKEAIDLLLDTRERVNIAGENLYPFVAGGGSMSHLRGHDVLRMCSTEANLIRPDLINSTKLRKDHPLLHIMKILYIIHHTRDEEEKEEKQTAPKKVKKIKNKGKVKQRAPCKKNKWSAEETEAVLTFFKADIKKITIPGKEKCEECIGYSLPQKNDYTISDDTSEDKTSGSELLKKTMKATAISSHSKNIKILENLVIHEANETKYGEIKILSKQECIEEVTEKPDKKLVLDKFLNSIGNFNEKDDDSFIARSKENINETKRTSEETVKSTEASDKSSLNTYRKQNEINVIEIVAASKKDGKRSRNKIHATKEISITMADDETSRPQFKIPSLALKIGYSLQNCVSIERGTALRTGNVKRNKSLSAFLKLMKLEWNARISSSAVATLYKRKMNAAQLLPITNDLVKLNTYIDSNTLIAKNEIESDERSPKCWIRLATLVLSRIILFNKRRSGEASRIKMSDYINRPMWRDQSTDEMKASLTAVERKLADNLTVVEVERKRGRKVPVILTLIIQEYIDLLIRHRHQCNISSQNKYIFARSNESLSHLRGHDCLHRICEEVKLENASLITGTKLRKYVATVSQLFNMSENEYDWLARHLGHDIRVHREFYRLHESAVELTKISRLLIAVDKGEANRFAGKRIEDISIEDLPCLEDEVENVGLESEDEEKIEGDSNGANEACKSQVIRKKIEKKEPPNNKNGRQRVYWSTEEKSAVLKFFRIHIKKGIVPKKEECEQCISGNEGALHRRKWKDVKNCVYNEIKSDKKLKK
nr:unnamed protein product [Callosobruchus analis]